MLSVLPSCGNVASFVGGLYPDLYKIYVVLGIIFVALSAHRWIYRAVGMFFTRKFAPAKNDHKYAILIAARNEEKVLKNLIDSIKQQDYDSRLLTVFVVADNCTDATARVARENGAVCYERFDKEKRTKGWALNFLFKKIEEDYGIESFEGYFVFDADNLLKSDYVTRMNEAFDSGEKLITSYRNTKNFDESWMASTYAIHWLRSARFNHRGRSFLRLSTNIQGTGFLFSNEIVKDGWKYTSLTEDRALTADAVAQGYSITYHDKAEFFDEQPTGVKIALRQRLRWSKGHLLAFAETGPYLFLNIFFGKRFLRTRWVKEEQPSDLSRGQRFLKSLCHRISSYDTLIQLTPFAVFNLFRWLIVSVFFYGFYCYSNGVFGLEMFAEGSFMAKLFNAVCPIGAFAKTGLPAVAVGIALQLWLRVLYLIAEYIKLLPITVYLFVAERKRIKKIPFRKKLISFLAWPTFDSIGRYTQYIALFAKVDWKPIPHESKITIEDLNKASKHKERVKR